MTNAGLAVQITYLQLQAARRSREAAERSAVAELLRFQVGVATNYEVVQAQDALTSAPLSELQAIINPYERRCRVPAGPDRGRLTSVPPRAEAPDRVGSPVRGFVCPGMRAAAPVLERFATPGTLLYV